MASTDDRSRSRRICPFESQARDQSTHYRIDQTTATPMPNGCVRDSPCTRTPEQYAAIKARDGLELLEPPQMISPQKGTIDASSFKLPVHGISLLLIAPA